MFEDEHLFITVDTRLLFLGSRYFIFYFRRTNILKNNKVSDRFLISLFFLIFFSEAIHAQDNLSFKYFGLSIHPHGERDNAHLMPNKLDKNAYGVINYGATLDYEKFIIKDALSLKAVQALYADCAEQFAGFSHIGLRAKIYGHRKGSLYGGIGPTLVYRKNWHSLDAYVDRYRFKGKQEDKWQYMFLWYGGELEYRLRLSESINLAVSFIPGYPDLMSLSWGISYHMPKKEKRVQ